jgi:hypothetical protein
MSKVIEMKGPLAETTHMPEAAARKLTGAAGAFAGLGIVLSVVAALVDFHRFAFAYLVGFSYAVTLGLGALFFILIVHATKAGWSVVARRQMEFVAGALPVCILLFIPIAVMAPTIFWEWWPGAAALNDPLLAKKQVWFEHGFFFIRAAIYLLAWSGLAWWFTRTSYEQDVSGDPRLSVRMQNASAPMIIVFALTISFAGFDWIMSLQPHWYSTIFGVYIFAGSFLTALAFLGLGTVMMHRAGWFKRISHVEHRHDIGKLMFAFTVFWAYIAFSQFMLIWYANLPEETIFFEMRWSNGWRPWSLLLIFSAFAVPFLYLLPRTIKRSMPALTLGAAILLFAHYVDLYWLIMPMSDHHHHFHYSWIDVAGFLGPVGVFLFVAARRAVRGPIYPLKDPYLAETVKVENL